MKVPNVAAALLCAVPCFAQAQAFPTRQVTIVVPYQPGGTNDIIARTLAPRLGEGLGHPVVVENKPGAGGNLGAALVAKSKPDGHTLLMAPVGSSPKPTASACLRRTASRPCRSACAGPARKRSPRSRRSAHRWR